MTKGSAETKQDLVVRIAEKWGYLIWNAHSEMTEDYAGVKSKVDSAIREALLEMAGRVEAKDLANRQEGPLIDHYETGMGKATRLIREEAER